MTAESPFEKLQLWYRDQCDGEWEHHYGIRIDTLDNPGWDVQIDIAGTSLAKRPFLAVKTERTGEAWCSCWVDDEKFRATCGVLNLSEAIQTFLRWANS